MSEEQPDFDSFALASPSVSLPRGKTPLWKVSQENPKFYSQAQTQAQQPTLYTQAQPIRTQAQPLLNQAQIHAQAPATSATGCCPCFNSSSGVRPANEDRFSFDLLDEASLRQKQARSELLDRVANFCGLES